MKEEKLVDTSFKRFSRYGHIKKLNDERKGLICFSGNDNLEPFQCSGAFHFETSHLICSAKQMAGFYIKYNTELEWVTEPTFYKT